ncbi:MAG TPA: hypothetical protein VIT65_03380 [Microlunatus sp.]
MGYQRVLQDRLPAGAARRRRDALVGKAAEARSPFSGVFLGRLGGALGRTDRATMALEVPDTKWFHFCEALWWDPAEAAA